MDMERYGDYTEYEDDRPKSKNPVLLILKIMIAVVCFSVIGILVFRMIFFRYYPSTIKNMYFTDELISYYNANGGNIKIETQDLRAPYDDPDVASFICDNLILVRDMNHLQVSARLNKSLYTDIFEKYGIEKEDVQFEFSLVKNPRADKEPVRPIGTLSKVITEENSIYTYVKLVFDDVDFGLDEGEECVNWIRLDISIVGADMESPFMVAIYENNVNYSIFKPYELGKEEIPNVK